MSKFSSEEKEVLQAVLNSSFSIINKTDECENKKSLFSGELGVGYFLSISEYNGFIKDSKGIDRISDILKME